jgi:hypothetical protein
MNALSIAETGSGMGALTAASAARAIKHPSNLLRS